MNAKDYDPKKVAEARKATGLTQRQLADDMGVTGVTISRVETGFAVSYELLTKIAQRCGKSVVDFLHAQPVSEVKNFSLPT